MTESGKSLSNSKKYCSVLEKILSIYDTKQNEKHPLITLHDVMTFPSTCRQLNQVGTRLIDRETNTSDIKVRSQREETRVDNSSNDEVIVPSHTDVQMPVSCSNVSSYDTEMTGGSCMRTCNTEMIPQLYGPMSVCSRRRMSENERTEQESSQRSAVIHRREYPDESSNDSHSG